MNDLSAKPMYVPEAEVSRRLQRFEEDRDILRLKIGRWSVWPLLRFSVARALQNVPLDAGGAGLTKRQLFPWIMRDVCRWPVVRRASRVIKTYSSYHTEVVDECRKDIFFDDVLLRTGSGFKIEVLNSRNIRADGVPLLIPPDLSSAGIGVLAGRLARRMPERAAAEVAKCISHAIDTEFGVSGFGTDAIIRAVSEFQWHRRLYRILLGRLRPRSLLLAETADYPVMAAARELGVEVVEFQHGVNDRHLTGNSWSAYALPYKASMPLPSRLFVFGPHWRRELSSNGFWNDELRSVGSLRVESYRAKGLCQSEVACTVLVTTQGTDTERLIAFLAEFRRMAGNRLPMRLIIKTHPVHSAADHLFKTAFGSAENVAVIGGSMQPSTFELIRQSHLHVSIYSACHYEALALGVPTVILPLSGMENVDHLRHSGHAMLARNPADLCDIVSRCRGQRVSSEIGDFYYARGAMRNIMQELEDLELHGRA